MMEGKAYVEAGEENYILEPGDLIVFYPADGSCNLFNRTASNPLLCPEIRSGTSEYIRFGTSIDFESDRHGSSGAEAIGLFFEREI